MSDLALGTLRQYWGYDSLRPMQRQAVNAAMAGHDSLVVLPTGGGKSLCYQLPAAMSDGIGLVVSPLISLMHDQVDGLTACGYLAVALHGGMTSDEQHEAELVIKSGKANLVYAAPERLLSGRYARLLNGLDVRWVVIDEAHCVSHWGHDFRPEYRRLGELRRVAPQASWHAYTATATQRVQDDICVQLRLHDPVVLVGDCDRPNLTYRVAPRTDGKTQLLQAINRHAEQAVIVYCIARKDTERTAEWLRSQGVDAKAYHAGMAADKRGRVQEAFMQERLHVVVATVAFGMGVDRSDVRCVVHMAMPKSIEHYQQEAGRAGRDGLEAECVLLYSSSDAAKWRQLMTRSAQEAGDVSTDDSLDHQLRLLTHMQRYCSRMCCRHAALAEYFGQEYPDQSCGACDVCLDENEYEEDARLVTQKIMSCVARVAGRFGAAHVVDVLRGSSKERVTRLGHDQLTVHGLLKDMHASVLHSYIDQLIDHGALERTDDEYPVIQFTTSSKDYLQGRVEVILRRPKVLRSATNERHQSKDWGGVDRTMFEQLRILRRQLAEERQVPAYLVFGDQTLRDMARLKPHDYSTMMAVKGVGQQKLREYGDAFIECINNVDRLDSADDA